MARISLRAYSRDIEVMIDKNQIDEAFAHCRYILELYPKHIDTYRLMGKALLEAQRFSDASDVFHRVLSSVPDDFIAHLGMSIIREDESDLDAAIWHMERSFEVQPSNAAVQVELRRLYGLRDGVTPQKIQLTRGALARMSAKSNLYSQAIAELRSALSNDPQRPDLQVVLAEMYLQTGSRMEAIETCNALITKLPYCLTANRILAEVLPETERADQAHEYKSRLGELDPYYLQISPVALTLDQVPDGAVTIERFEYTGEPFELAESDQPAWAATLGVDLDDEQSASDEPAPDWIDESEKQPEMVPPSDIEEDAEPVEDEERILPAEEKDGGTEELPDWMNGLDESGEEEAPAQDVKSEKPFEDAEEMKDSRQFTSLVDAEEAIEEVPDWMREVDEDEEQDATSPVPGIAAAAGAAAIGAVIAGQEDEQVESESEQDAEQAAADAIQEEDEVGEPLPDWMASAAVEEEPLDAEEPDDLIAESPAFEQEDMVEEDVPGTPGDQDDAQQLPEWMSEAEPAAEGETPEWLQDAMESPDGESDARPPAAAFAAGAAILSADDADEPVADAETRLEDEIPLTPEPESESADQVTGEDLPDLTAGEDALEGTTGEDSPEEETPEKAGLTAGEAAIAGAAAMVSASLDEDDQITAEAVDDAGLPPADELAPLLIEDEGISEADEDIPDWLQDLGEDMPPAEETEEPPVFEVQPADDEPGSELEIEPGTEDIESEAVPETVTADDDIVPGELPVEQAELFEESEFPESIPVWLSEVSPEEIPEEVAEAEAGLDIVRAEIPVWLRKMEDQHKAEMESADEVESIEELELDAEFTELSGEDVPSWLMSAMEPKLPPEVDEITEVEDISDVFVAQEPVEIGELGLEGSLVEEPEPESVEDADGALESAEVQEELASQEVSPEAQIDSDEPAVEAIDEDVVQVDELMQPESEVVLESEEVVEEIVPGEDLVPELTEGEDEGFGFPGMAAAGAAAVVAADLLDDEDTQPIAVTDEPAHPGELDSEEIVEDPAMETGEDLLEVEDDVEEQVLEPEGEIHPPGDIEEAEVPALAADAPLSGEEEDAAMAWLESLAAKQGAAEEELLTPADQRLEQPPEWVQEEASEIEPQKDEDIEARDTALTAAALAGVTAGILADHEESEDVDMAGEEGPETVALLDEPSEWMPEVLEEQELVPGAESEGGDIEPEALEIEEPPGVVEEAAAPADADLEQAETEDTPEEIPDWLSGLAEEQEGTLETEADEWTPDMLAEEVEEPAATIEAAQVEKIDLNAASLSQLERIPGIGFIFAQNIVSHRAESGSFTDLEQLGEVEGISPEMVTDLSEYLTVEVVTEISPSESETPELQDAWDSIAEGNIEKAVDQYADLINQDQYLDEIIRDLQSAINKYPSDSALYQCLGDAYMHTNMLQEALDAYNRAEDLI